MTYFAITVRSVSDEDGEECGFYDFNLVDRSLVGLRWYDGISLGESAPAEVELSINDMNGWASVFPEYSNTPVPLMSKRLVECLNSAGASNLECIPARIVGMSDKCPPYWVVNVVGSVMAADPSLSKFQRLVNAPGADIFDSLVLNPSAVGALDLFRLAESVSTLVVSSRIRDAVELAGFQTVAFEPLKSGAD